MTLTGQEGIRLKVLGESVPNNYIPAMAGECARMWPLHQTPFENLQLLRRESRLRP
jgi:hypothetical protein